MVKYSSFLKDKYKQMNIIPDNWPPDRIQESERKGFYTNLALIKSDRFRGESEVEKLSKNYA